MIKNPQHRRQSGLTTVFVAIALVGLLAFGAFAVDVGMVWSARTQLQGAADSAALAGARQLIDGTGAVDQGSTVASAQAVGALNEAITASSVSIAAADIDLGFWDSNARSFDPNVDLTDPSAVNAVDVVARLDAGINGPVTAVLSRVIGIDSFDIQANATAELGFAGSSLPGTIDLPIAIDCCQLAGADCQADYCSTIANNPPNPCSLEDPQDPDLNGGPGITCLEFHNTNDQNACWIAYDDQSPSVNTADLRDLVETGVDQEVSVDDSFYVDNGDKTPVIGEIDDKFQGTGSYTADGPSGTDRYAPIDGVMDSWVVKLPVIECQSDDHCAGGDTADLVGFVCFELREINVTPGKVIRGRFLCPTDPLFDECDLGGGTGGLDFGIRADIPKLVR
jgi:Flp pilus assembly protein TadG